MSGDEPVGLSVVIPCRNAAAYLSEQLRALAAEQLDGRWEIVLVDNGSTDGSVAVAEDLRSLLPCSLVVVDASGAVGAARARNEGAALARGQSLLFVDADDVIAPGYVSVLLDALAHHELVAGALDHRSLNPDWVVASRPMWQTTSLGQGLYPWAGSGTIGVRAETFRSVQGFDEELPAGEDLDLCWRLRRARGIEAHFCPGAVLRYRYRPSLTTLFRQGLHYGLGGPALYRRWQSEGMERRPPRSVVRNWLGVLRRLVGARSKAELGSALYLLGNRLGLLLGSIRFRVLYL